MAVVVVDEFKVINVNEALVGEQAGLTAMDAFGAIAVVSDISDGNVACHHVVEQKALRIRLFK